MREIYHSERIFNNWFKKADSEGIKGLNREFSNITLQFIKDMVLGVNISKASKRGARSKKRLNTLRQKVSFVFSQLQKRGIPNIKKITKESLHQLFDDMRTGVLSNRSGKPYLSAGDYVKDFKVFWHWYQKVSKEKKDLIIDLTEDLDRRGEKPKFVFFTKEEFEEMLKSASRDLQIIMVVLFDAGCRVTELLNIQIKDFGNDFKELTIKEESAKTFGRKIKLMFCSEQIKNYVKELNLKSEDYLIKKSSSMANRELRTVGKKVLGEERVKEKNLTMYDFRHSSACFWVVRYKSESALKYRFGWRKSEMIHYYTEFLGMTDTINEGDLYIDVTKTELEKDNLKIKEQMKNVLNDLGFLKEFLRKSGDKKLIEFLEKEKAIC